MKQAAVEAGIQIEPAAARLVAERAGADIGKLRGDVERLMLFAAGSPKITVSDARAVVSAASSQDDWAVTTAIQRGQAAEALRELALSLESGGVPYMILGQLAWFVREKLAMTDPRRVAGAVDALFRRTSISRARLETHGCSSSDSWWSCAGDWCEARPRSGLRRRRLPADTRRKAGLVASGRVAVNQALARHLVDKRDRLTERVFHVVRRACVDRCPDVPQGAAKPGAELAIPFALSDVLPMRFERGVVTGHCASFLWC